MKTVILFLVSCFLLACNSKPVNTATEQSLVTQMPSVSIEVKDSFETGKVIPSVALRNNASETFALFLPKGYSDSGKLPVIIFFDPHGDGTVLLNLYHELADEFHFVLVGSNNSKNGMDLQQTKLIADNLVNEVKARFSINDKSISFCGFSRGAKVALLSAAENSSVSSVIYCGAAAPINPNHSLSLLGFAGTKDMNYTDIVSFDWSLKSSALKHFLIEWNGKHEFPKAEVFKDAFQFLTTGNIENYLKKQVTITEQKVNEEQAFKQQLLEAFQTQDINWWKQEIVSLNNKKKTDPMYERLLGFISLACYSYSNQTLQQNDLQAAEKILAIYQLADPGNKDCEAFTTQLKSRQLQH